MSDKKKAFIVYGGWDGHEPEKVSARFGRILEEEGIEVAYSQELQSLADTERLMGLHLIVPIWTGGELSREATRAVSSAVAAGVGMAGNHGGMCDAFRTNTEWQFITGGNWVSHPGGCIDYTVNVHKNAASPIVDGIEDFPVYNTEQYYLHVDPAVEVLATTRFPVATYYHAANKAVDMPVIWTKKWGHGRIFYNSLGHTDEVFSRSPSAELLMRRGMLWAIEGRDIAIERGLDPAIYTSTTKNY